MTMCGSQEGKPGSDPMQEGMIFSGGADGSILAWNVPSTRDISTVSGDKQY